jgi:hypothetical protein
MNSVCDRMTEYRQSGNDAVSEETTPSPGTVVFTSANRKGELKDVAGSQCDATNMFFINQAINSVRQKGYTKDQQSQHSTAAVGVMAGIAPTDELEGMMAAQLFAAHNAAMECYRRAMGENISFEARRENLSQANKLSRTYATLLESLNRHRGKGQQKVTVEHVHVHSGGQAVVGVVEPAGGGDRAKSEDQPHAKQIAHAPQPSMRRPDEGREPVPVAGDAERPLPIARGPVARRTQGQ